MAISKLKTNNHKTSGKSFGALCLWDKLCFFVYQKMMAGQGLKISLTDFQHSRKEMNTI